MIASLIFVNREEIIRMGQNPDTSASNGDGKYFAMVEVFHQLHCLDLIRKHNFRVYYSDFVSFSNGEAETFEHVGTSSLTLFKQTAAITNPLID